MWVRPTAEEEKLSARWVWLDEVTNVRVCLSEDMRKMWAGGVCIDPIKVGQTMKQMGLSVPPWKEMAQWVATRHPEKILTEEGFKVAPPMYKKGKRTEVPGRITQRYEASGGYPVDYVQEKGSEKWVCAQTDFTVEEALSACFTFKVLPSPEGVSYALSMAVQTFSRTPEQA